MEVNLIFRDRENKKEILKTEATPCSAEGKQARYPNNIGKKIALCLSLLGGALMTNVCISKGTTGVKRGDRHSGKMRSRAHIIAWK